MVRFKTLSRDEAKRIISAFDNYDDVEFDDLVNHWEQYDPVSEYDESFVDFRNELLAAFREGLQETNLRWNGGEAGRKCWVTKI